MRTLLFLLISFVAVTSIFSGLLMMSSPDGTLLHLPINVLKDTSFKDFLIPGILLTIIVGGVNLVAALYNLQRRSNRYNWAIAGGIIISGWIVTQMLLIQAAHWLHFLYLGVGILIVLLAYQLKGKWAV